MKKIKFGIWTLAALVSGILMSEGHAASTYVFKGTTTSTQSGGTDPALTGIASFNAANGGTYNTLTKAYTIDGFDSVSGTVAKWKSGTTSFYGASAGGTNGGLGNVSDGDADPNHAIDNGAKTGSGAANTAAIRGNTEAVMLSFSDSVVLTHVDFGYVSGDADFSIFRYIGKTPPVGASPTFTGTEASLTAMLTAGWQLVGNYGTTVTGGNPAATALYDTNGGTGGITGPTAQVGSSWWLISAYNTNYSTTDKNFGNLNQGNDYFKLYAVKASACTSTVANVCEPTNVPEPGSLALVSLGILGLAVQYRSRRKQSRV